MFKRFAEIIRNYRIRKAGDNPAADAQSAEDACVSPKLAENIRAFRRLLGDSGDVVIREFRIGPARQANGALVFIEGLVDAALLDTAVMKPLMFDADPGEKDIGCRDGMEAISHALVAQCRVTRSGSMDALVMGVLAGDAALLADGCAEALLLGVKKWDKRAVEEPATETVVRGPRLGFTETLRTNTALLRRLIRNQDLRMEQMKMGEQTGTDICIAYLQNAVMPGLLEEIRARLRKAGPNAVLESGVLQAYLEDAPHSLFNTINSSERPDMVAASLLKGRAAILVDGSPFVLVMPMLFVENFQTAEDYYIKAWFASILRLIRLLSYVITVSAPAVYVALTTFHQELIPTQLLFTMAAGHEGIPFPSLVEAILMMIMFDVLKEAGVRLPKPIGSAVSIVGALVLGESAVTAGLVGPFMVIVVAITAITGFAVPSQINTTLVLRYIVLICAGFLGGFGIVMAFLMLLLHLVSLVSFGVPYLWPLAPLSLRGLKDSVVRLPKHPKAVMGSGDRDA